MQIFKKFQLSAMFPKILRANLFACNTKNAKNSIRTYVFIANRRISAANSRENSCGPGQQNSCTANGDRLLRINRANLIASNESKRFQGTNFVTINPSANIQNRRVRQVLEPWHVDMMTPDKIRPRLPESITPVYARYPKDVEPWPYREKGYFWRHRYLDDTLKRFDENTRLIVVEAPPGAGCTEFCQELSKQLDFHYIPQPKIEDILVDRYGIDKRDFYHIIPEKFCLFDAPMFFTAPNHPNVIVRQFFMFYLKVEAYTNALAHILNTGQGVILDRSMFTDIAFVRAMHEKGFVTDAYAKWYPKFHRKNLFNFDFFPHLCIYLDCPASTCMENIRKRGRPYEMLGKVYDYDYINQYKYETEQVLKRLAKEGEVLIFDWKTPLDIDDVLDEIYKIDFTFDWNVSDRFWKWNSLGPMSAWNEVRNIMTMKDHIFDLFENYEPEVQELVPSPADLQQLRFVMDKIVGKYCVGYNWKRGDSLLSILFQSNPDSPSAGNWVEYSLSDNLWCQQYQHIVMHFEPPLMPDIPEEEFEPRRFDVALLEDWDHH